MFTLTGDIIYSGTDSIRFSIFTSRDDNPFFINNHSIYESAVCSVFNSSNINTPRDYDPDNKLSQNGFYVVKSLLNIPYIEYISVTQFHSNTCDIIINLGSHYNKDAVTVLIITALTSNNDILFNIIKRSIYKEDLKKEIIYYNFYYTIEDIICTLYFNDNLLKHPLSKIYGMILQDNNIIISPLIINNNRYNINNIKRKYFGKIRKIFSLEYPHIKYINCLHHSISIFFNMNDDFVNIKNLVIDKISNSIFTEFNLKQLIR